MVKYIVLPLLLVFNLSCKKNNKDEHMECRYEKPYEIFKDSSFYEYHNFKINKINSTEEVEFKPEFKPPFKSLKIKQEGCDVLIQHFTFEGGSLIENFLFLGSLDRKYVVYLYLVEELEEIDEIDFGEVKKLSEKFYIKISQENKDFITISMADSSF